MDLRQLRYFVSVVEAGSFSGGAMALNLTQPSLSRQIALLEDELGQRLLVRNGRGVAANEAGHVLLGRAREMLEISRRAREELRDLEDSPRGKVVIGMPPRVALGISAPLIQRFRDRFPRAVITVLEGLSVSLRDSLIAGKMDAALLFDPVPSPQLALEPLIREKLLLVAPASSTLPARVGLSSLSSYPMVLPSAPNAIRQVLDDVLQPRGVRLHVLAEVGTVQTVLDLVRVGVGCTILPESGLGPPGDLRLVHAPIGPPVVWSTLMLATPLARPATRITRGTTQLLREIDFRAGRPAPDK